MAGRWIELVLVFSWTLALSLQDSVQGWERIDEKELLNRFQTGKWDDSLSGPAPDQRSFFDSEEEEEEEEEEEQLQITEDPDPEAEGVATSLANFDPFGDHGFDIAEEVEEEEGEDDSDSTDWAEATGSDFQVEFEETSPSSWSGRASEGSAELKVVCGETGFQISLPEELLHSLAVLGPKDQQYVVDAPESCGYQLNSSSDTLTISFDGCHVTDTSDGYSLQLQFVDQAGQTQVSTVTCEVYSHLNPRGGGKRRCCKPPKIHTVPSKPSKAHNCAVTPEERVSCGHGLTSTQCTKKGCCMDTSTYDCYYPLDECTADHHFVFAIRAQGSSVPVNPKGLVIPGHPNCKPVIVNHDVAIFKFKVNECGTRAYEVGEMKIYLAEVQTVVRALNLKYGIITRCDPLRFMIECRYTKCGPAKQSLASVGYMVKTPTSSLPSSILSNGLYGIQLRIAEDKTYSKYLPTYHQPLRLLLGKPVYLELRLKSPKPDAVIIVNYCLAYPRSAKNALVLVYEGCANPNDPNVAILKVHDLPNNRHQRRLVVSAFQFMEQTTNKYLDEEIYFMCSAEVCRPREKRCKQQCFDGKH